MYASWINFWYFDKNDTDKTISLTGYSGTETTLKIPNKATINGEDYSIIYGKGTHSQYNAQVTLFGKNGENSVQSLSFEKGVKFPADSSYLFYSPSHNFLSLDLTGVDTSNVTNMSYMINCESLTSLNLGGIDTSNVTNMSWMFANCRALESLNLDNFDTSNVIDMSYMFRNCAIKNIDFSKLNTSKVTTMQQMFDGATLTDSQLTDLIANLNISKVESMKRMLWNCDSLINPDVSNWNTSNVTDMSEMFAGCSNMESINLNKLKTSKVTTMSNMFENCSKLSKITFTNVDARNVTDMGAMFRYCENLTDVNFAGFKTAKLTNMWSMFSLYRQGPMAAIDTIPVVIGDGDMVSSSNTTNGASNITVYADTGKLTNLDISDFDLSNVTSMSYMFKSQPSLQNIKLPSKINKNCAITLSDLSLPSQNANSEAVTWYSLAEKDAQGTEVVASNKVSEYAGKILAINSNKTYEQIDSEIFAPSTPTTGVVLDVVLPVASIVLVLASLVAVAFVGKKKKQF